MSRILVIDDDVNLLQMVRLMLQRVGHSVETSNNGEEGLSLAARSQPDLAIIDVMMPGLSGYDVVRRLRDDPLTARIPIIILTARSQPMDKHMALEAGANAFLSKPVTAQELTERVEAVLKAGVNYRVHTGLLTEPVRHTDRPETKTPPERPATSTGPQTPAPGIPAPRQPMGAESLTAAPQRPGARRPIGVEEVSPSPAPDVASPRLPVITVGGLRGGTGSTTVAVNLAFLLANRGRRVCLVDLSTVSGHLSLHLHLAPPQNWSTLLNMGDAPDPRAIASLLVQHHTSGITLLSAPIQPTTLTLSTEAMQHVLRELSNQFQHIIVDAPALDPATIGALLTARSVVLVITDDAPGVQTAAQSLLVLQKMGIEMGRVRVALNHVRPGSDIPVETIQKAIKRPLSVEIPFDTNQVNAIRRGVPLVVADPASPFTQAIQQLTNTMTL